MQLACLHLVGHTDMRAPVALLRFGQHAAVDIREFEYLELTDQLWAHANQVHDDVSLEVAEDHGWDHPAKATPIDGQDSLERSSRPLPP